MKKKLTVISSLFLLSLCTGVNAEVTPVAGTNNNIIVSGTAQGNKMISVVLLNNTIVPETDRADASKVIEAYKDIILSGTKATTDHIRYYTQLTSKSDGSYSVDIPMGDTEKGEYTVYVNNGDYAYIPYTSNSYRTGLISDIKDGNVTAETAISENIPYISSKSALYAVLSDKDQVAVMTEENIKKIDITDSEKAISELMALIDEAVTIQALAEGKIADYDSAKPSLSEMEEMDVIIATVTEDGEKAVLENIKGAPTNDVNDFKTNLKLQFALNSVCYNVNSTAENILKALKDNNKYIGLDLSELLTLSQTNQALAVKNTAQKKPTTKEAAQTALDNAVEAIKKKTNSGGSSGSGGSGSGSGGSGRGNSSVSSGPVVSINTAISSAANGRDIFSDLSNYDWAKPAIEKLVEYKIVSGYDDLTFRPANNVTRAEFVKMIINAFYSSELSASSSVFSDVKDSDWHCEYIMTAYEKNLVSGVGNDMFAPSERISRQDMSVILYNAAKAFNILSDGEKTEFADDSLIADYAREAVYTLKGMGIINGQDGNLFAPWNFATRAEAAKIIYSLIPVAEEE